MDKLRLALLQNGIVWEDKAANLAYCEERLAALSGRAEVAILPEMFTTGFTMSASSLAEEGDGMTLQTLRKWASAYGLALVGSYIAREGESCYNRGFFVTPGGEVSFYDKRHLFRMGEEGRYFKAGDRRLVVEYEGWRIALFVCYDLRFPVWCRNVANEYDLALFVASWPRARAHAWRSLLVARAIENAAYVCGVNRVGCDNMGLVYDGDTMAIDFKGNAMAKAPDGEESVVVVELDKLPLLSFREKFPVWRDADSFAIDF